VPLMVERPPSHLSERSCSAAISPDPDDLRTNFQQKHFTTFVSQFTLKRKHWLKCAATRSEPLN